MNISTLNGACASGISNLVETRAPLDSLIAFLSWYAWATLLLHSLRAHGKMLWILAIQYGGPWHIGCTSSSLLFGNCALFLMFTPDEI